MLGPVGMLTHPAREHTAKSGNNFNSLSVMIFRGPLNKSRGRDNGFAGWDARKATKGMVRPRRGKAVSSEGRCDPVAGCTPPSYSIIAVAASPSAARSRFAGPSGNASGAPFARSLTKQPARKALSRLGCGKIECSLRCTPWRRRPSYDLRHAPCDHLDFTSNALREGFVQRFLSLALMEKGEYGLAPAVILPDFAEGHPRNST